MKATSDTLQITKLKRSIQLKGKWFADIRLTPAQALQLAGRLHRWAWDQMESKKKVKR